MSHEAQELIRRFQDSPVAVQREVSIAVLETQFRLEVRRPAPCLRISDIAGRFPPQRPEEAKPHDRWFAEAVVASKSASSSP